MNENKPETKSKPKAPVRSLYWEKGILTLLDQTKLPVEVVYETQESIEQVWDSIKKLKVRGAPAIGVAGAYGLLYGVSDCREMKIPDFLKNLKEKAAYLDTARPTAVNLSWALKRMAAKAESLAVSKPSGSAGSEGITSKELYIRLEEEAKAIHEEDKALSRGMGECGKSLIKEGMGVLTHCNAGSLAASILGTATAPMYMAHEAGVNFKVFADETRPLLQGARLTAWELQQAGIDVTLICDSTAAFMMSKGSIDLIIVGTDRVAANGDTANKIGTMGVAILAKHFNIPFYVACPSSTFDLDTEKGDDIVIEERGHEEVTSFGERRTGPKGIKVRNPAFDVTPHELIEGFITEKGIVRPPYRENLERIFKD